MSFKNFVMIMIIAVITASSLALIPTITEGGGEWTGEGTFEFPYEIWNEGDLRSLADEVNGGNAQTALYFAMMANIHLSGPFTPIGNIDNPFSGTFSGNGHTITGLSVEVDGFYSDTVCAGLFGVLRDGTVEGVNLDSLCSVSAKVTFDGGTGGAYIFVGAIVGHNEGTVLNCSNSGTVYVDYYYTYSGSLNGNEMRACAGGIVGRNSGTVDGCHNEGPVSASSDGGTPEAMNSFAGGITGLNESTVINCSNSGSADAYAVSLAVLKGIGVFARAGGIAGFNTGEISYSNNSGSVSALSEVTDQYTSSNPYPYAESNAGGIAGYNWSGSITRGCHNTGQVHGETLPYSGYPKISYGCLCVGGIIGSSNGTVEDSFNGGSVTASGKNFLQVLCVGGIAGEMNNPAAVIRNCYNTSSMIASEMAYGTNGWINGLGGIVGNVWGGVIENCYNKGYLELAGESNHTDVGGIVGSIYDGNIADCYWYANAAQIVNGDEQSIKGIGYDQSSIGHIVYMFYPDSSIQDAPIMVGGMSVTYLLDALNAYVDDAGGLESWIIISSYNDGFPIFGATATVTVNLNGSPWSGRNVQISKDGGTKIALLWDSMSETYFADAVNGTYVIYVDDVNTAKTVVINHGDGGNTLNYWGLTVRTNMGITSVTGGGNILEGASVTIGASVTAGYLWDGWINTASTTTYSKTKEYTFTMPRNELDITATATKKEYYIVASAGAGSSISPSGQIMVLKGTSQTFTFSALSGYYVSSVMVDDIPLSQAQIDSGQYTFYDVIMNHTIRVGSNVRTAASLTINIIEGKGYTQYSVNGSDFATYFSTVILPDHADIIVRAYADNGYEFREWRDGPAKISSSEASFTDIRSPLSLDLYFTEENDSGSIPWLIPAAILLAVAALIWIIFFFRLRTYEVVKVTSSAAIIGRDSVRRKKAYTFTVEGGPSGSVSYRIGENGSWKNITPNPEGKYIIPKGEVTDKVTIEQR